MKPIVAKILISGCVLLVASVTARALLRQSYRNAAAEVCELIERHYYKRDDPSVRRFLSTCQAELHWSETIGLDRELITARINARLRRLGISHLALHSPAQTQQVWENEGLDTGLRARRIEDKLVVSRVLAQSVADRAGLVRGDVVLSIDGEEPSFPGDVEAAGGLYRLSRQGKIFEMKLVPEGLTENLEPKLRAMDAGGGVGLLELPSFLPQYFDERAWRALASRLTSYTALVVDLRGNAGGSFPAMLRALSPFLCEQKQIGVVYQAPAGRKLREAALRDQLDTNSQLEQLEEADSLRLMTFDGYGCFRGPVVALIDGETASVAEIFAQALFARPRSRVWGQFSSGRVVMAEWFNVHGFGEPPSMLSVPIAGYVASDGVEIEGRGIEPERTLYYELQDALLGRDNWVESARTAVSK